MISGPPTKLGAAAFLASASASTFNLTSTVPTVSRNAAIALFVVLLHVGVLWALTSGMLVRVTQIVIPVTVLAQLIEPPKPKAEPPPPPPPPRRAAVPPPPPVEVKKVAPKAPLVLPPLPKAIVEPTPAPNAPTGAPSLQPAPAPVAITNATSATPATPAPAAPTLPAAPRSTAVQQPSSDADYLQNPKPPYPPISRRLNEQGTSVVRVLVGADGTPQSAEINKSSGFARLDSAAVATAMRWRYVPGKRGGAPEAMSVNVPIVWVLD